MSRLAGHLQREGYTVANWGYPSIRGSIETKALHLRQRLTDLMQMRGDAALHVVGHSMGGIIARRAFSLNRPARLGRFVMLGPPNRGSHVARAIAPVLGALCPPLRQLSDAPDSYVNCLELPCDIELGVIAAADDLVVPLESTRLPTQKDHIILPGHHGVLPLRKDTAIQVTHFMRHGMFHRSQSKATEQ